MKTIQINAVYGEKSTGLIVRDIQHMLEQNGIEAYVGYQKSNCPVYKGIQIGDKLDWKLHAAYTRITGKQGYASVNATKRFLKEIDPLCPEIIHLHNLHSNYINLPLLLEYCAEKNIKTMLTLHDCWFLTGKCFHFFDIECDRYKTGCYNCPKKNLDVPNYLWDRSAAVWSDRKRLFQQINHLKVVGCSQWIAGIARQSEIFQGKQIISIKNGIDTDIFKKRNSRLKSEMNIENKFVILGMANKWLLNENRNVVDEICQGVPDGSVIVLVGCDESQIEKLKVAKNIISLGYIKNREKLADLYSMADVFVNLSLIDSLPTVNMESIACGTPVICYENAGGGTELVEHGKTGYIVEKFNAAAILRYINEIKSGSIDAEKCASEGREKYSNKNNYLKYLHAYERWD